MQGGFNGRSKSENLIFLAFVFFLTTYTYKVVAVEASRAKVHYLGYNNGYDEWLVVASYFNPAEVKTETDVENVTIADIQRKLCQDEGSDH